MEINLINEITIETVNKVTVNRTIIDHNKETITYFLSNGKPIVFTFSKLPPALVEGFKAASAQLLANDLEEKRVKDEQARLAKIPSVVVLPTANDPVPVEVVPEPAEEPVIPTPEEVLPPIATEPPVTEPGPII